LKFFFPIIAVLLFYSLKSIFDVENNKFENKEGSIQNYARMRSVYNSDIFPQLNATPNINPSADNEQIIPQIPIMTPEIYGMSIHSAFNICSIFNEKKEIRPLIATIGVPNEIKEKMIYESTRFVLNQSSFKDFRTEEDLDKYIKSENYGETEEMPKICFGISFSQVPKIELIINMIIVSIILNMEDKMDLKMYQILFLWIINFKQFLILILISNINTMDIHI